MKGFKLMLGCFVAVCVSLPMRGQAVEPSVSPDRSQVVYDETLSHLDQGGLSLSYKNTDAMRRMLARCESFIQGVLAKELNHDGKLQATVKMVKSLFRRTGLEQIQAYGMSIKRLQSPVVQYTCFVNLGGVPTTGVLFDLIGKSNHRLTLLDSLPASTLFALEYELTPGLFWRNLKQALSGVADVPPTWKQGIQQLEREFEQEFGCGLDAVLQSVSGVWKIALIGGKPLPQLYVSVPDRQGVLVFLLTKLQCLKAGKVQNQYVSAFPWLDGSFPTLSVSKGRLEFLSNPVLRGQLTGGLQDVMKRDGYYTESMGRGIGAGLVNIDPGTWGMLTAMVPAPFNAFLQKLPAPRLYGCASWEAEGLGAVKRFNWELTPDTAGVAVLAGMLLPALDKAREKADQISCINNLKQLGLGFMMYRGDHDDRLPAQAGVEGLQQLLSEGYIPAEAFVCPADKSHSVSRNKQLTPANCSYIYLGKEVFNPGKPSQSPLVLERPGLHKEGFCVGFADGHVEFVKLDGQSALDKVVELLEKSELPRTTQGQLRRIYQQQLAR